MVCATASFRWRRNGWAVTPPATAAARANRLSAQSKVCACQNVRMPVNIPTTLTWIRIALIPAFVGVYYLPHDWLTPTQQNWTGADIHHRCHHRLGRRFCCAPAR